jgi:hypothetical protein
VAVFGRETDAAEFTPLQSGSWSRKPAQGRENSFAITPREIVLGGEWRFKVLVHCLTKMRTLRVLPEGAAVTLNRINCQNEPDNYFIPQSIPGTSRRKR